MKILGYILIIFAVVNYASSYAGYNLTPFLSNEIASFSPIVIGLVGVALVYFSNNNS